MTINMGTKAYQGYLRDEYGMYMAVTQDFKYIYSAPDQKEWLFDLNIDPQETRNRAYSRMKYYDVIIVSHHFMERRSIN